MAFGSVAVSFRGTSFKIHWLNNPYRLICSQVFLAPKQNYNSSNNASFSATSSSSRFFANVIPSANDTASSSVSESISLNSISISENFLATKNNNENLNEAHTALSLDNDELRFVSQMSNEDSSGYSSSEPWHQKQLTSTRSSMSSIFSDFGSNSRKLSIESVSEFPSEHEQLNRRILRNLSTSFENVPMTSTNSSISSLNMNSGNVYYNTITGTSSNGMSDGWLSKVRRNSEIFVRRKTSSGDALIPANSLSQRKRSRLAIAVVSASTPTIFYSYFM